MLFNLRRSYGSYVYYALAALLSVAVTLASCDFRDPGEGYDRSWVPDHEAVEKGSESPDESSAALQEDEATGSLEDHTADRSFKRPADIAADTARMQTSDGQWSQMNGSVKTSYRVYREGGTLAMIVEKTEESTRTYYYNDGTLFYVTEKSDDGSTELIVEFDDFGDVRGARKNVNGRRQYTDEDEFSEIVEHAVELRVASEGK